MAREKYYWLTTTHQSNIKEFTVSTKNRQANEENLKENCLWFRDCEEDIARSFLKDVKSVLYDLYHNKYGFGDRATWLTKDWIND